MANFEAVDLKRNGKGYLIDDFMYIKCRERNGTLYLRCQEFKSSCKCTAAAKIKDLECTITNSAHTHVPPDIEAIRFRAAVVSKARDPKNARLTLSEIYEAQKENAGTSAASNAERDEIAVRLPDLESVKTAMHAARTGHLPKNPTTPAQIDLQVVLEKFKDANGNSFLLSSSQNNEIMIFGDIEMFPRLQAATALHIDGTFWVVPSTYGQLVTIHSMVLGQMFPFFYVLLPNKSKNTYDQMFEIIFNLISQNNVTLHNLQKVQSDFESGLIASLKDVLPRFFPNQNVIHKGCNFHFAQATYRNVGSMGYQGLYQNNTEFRSGVRHLLALGHVPANQKLEYYFQIMATFCGANPDGSQRNPEFQRFAEQYFYPTWLQPGTTRYDPEMWTWIGESIRTNNHVESWHATLKQFFKQPGLGFYKFLTFLHKKEIQTKRMLADRVAGKKVPDPNKKYARLNQRIATLHQEFPYRSAIDYLSGIAHNVPNPTH